VFFFFSSHLDDGWIKSQRLTAHQVGYARVDKLYDENKQLIQDILLSNYSVPPTPSLGTDAQVDYDALTLGKMRALYNSCIDEEYLGFLGKDPLMRVVRTIRRLFREEGTEIEVGEEGPLPGQKLKGNGLTAAVAFLHSRGASLWLKSIWAC
jgi:endothelin-converting enzyme